MLIINSIFFVWRLEPFAGCFSSFWRGQMTRADQASISRGHGTAAPVRFTFILPGCMDQHWLHLSLWVTCQDWFSWPCVNRLVTGRYSDKWLKARKRRIRLNRHFIHTQLDKRKWAVLVRLRGKNINHLFIFLYIKGDLKLHAQGIWLD